MRLNDACTRAQLKLIQGDEKGRELASDAEYHGGCLFLCATHGGASLIFGRARRVTYNGMCRDYKL